MLTRKWYAISKSKVSNEKINEIKKELSVQPYTPRGFGPPPPIFKIYKENETSLYIPRRFGIELMGPPKIHKISDGSPIHTPFQGNLRDQQIPIVNTVLNELQTNNHCIMSLKTGGGKTICALNLVTKLKQKTLILVHQDFLLNQWFERITQFIPSARIGILKQSNIDVEDKDIVIGMIQSICSRKYESSIFKKFGFVIMDEVHHVSSQYFSQVLFTCGAKYMLGLSATPQRKDGLTKVLKWHLGKILMFKNDDIVFNVLVQCIHFFPDDGYHIKKNYYGGINMADLINQICKNKQRNTTILKHLIHYGRKGRQILVLSDRVQHLKDLQKKIPEDILTGLYIGGMTQEQRKISETKTIIFGTYTLVKEAVDIPSLNTLFLSTPKSDVQQACGRILRKKHPKFNPLIIDMIDEYPVFENQYKKRNTFYIKEGYKIKDTKFVIKEPETSSDCLFI